jgi:hypothetical protein
VDPQGHFTKCTFPYKLDELIVVKGCGGDLIVSLDVGLNELDDLVSFAQDILV